MKIIFLSLLLSFSLLSAETSPSLDKESCLYLQGSIIKSVKSALKAFDNNQTDSYYKHLQYQKEKIGFFNSNKCYIYFDNPDELKSNGESALKNIDMLLEKRK